MNNEPENIDIHKLGKSVAELLVEVKFARSKREARQFIKDGAVTLGDIVLHDPHARLCEIEGKLKILQHMETNDGTC